jgi:hypothetical protein
MSDDTFKPISDDRPAYSPGTDAYINPSASTGEAGKTFLAGVVGGVLSAAGYLVYTRLPDEQKERLHAQARALIESRVNELRGRFNL